MTDRVAQISRDTLETKIKVSVNLDGTGRATFDTGLPFFEHMLDQVARHGLIDMTVDAKGDIDIDDHHTVEDIGICLGEVLREAIGDKSGISKVTETHEMGWFTQDEYSNAFMKAGLELEYLEEGLTGRGIYIGTKL